MLRSICWFYHSLAHLITFAKHYKLSIYLCFSRKLATKKSVRIIVYRNGKCTEPVEIVAELDKKEEVGKTLNYRGKTLNCRGKTLNYRHTCDLSRSGIKLPIWRLPLRPPDEAAKILIFMNFEFSLFPKAKTCFPITADACFI